MRAQREKRPYRRPRRAESWSRPGTLPRLVSLAVALLLCACGGTVAHQTRLLTVRTPTRLRAAAAASSADKPIDPAVFAPGACVAFSPTANDRGLTVFLDAGHGGIDPGAAGTTESGQIIYESHETLAVELDTMTILRRQGFRVVVSRTRDTSLIRLGPGDISRGILTAHGSHSDAVARDVCANDAHADVLVGIYFNAGGPSNAGCLTAYDAVRPFAAENRRLAGVVEADVLAAMNARGWGIPYDGAVSDAGLGSAVSAASLAGTLSCSGRPRPATSRRRAACPALWLSRCSSPTRSRVRSRRALRASTSLPMAWPRQSISTSRGVADRRR